MCRLISGVCICTVVFILKKYLSTHPILVYTLSLIDTSDDQETLEFVCPDPVFDPESFMYNISVMWNITNPLLIDGVGEYLLHLRRINIAQSSFSLGAVLQPEVRTMNTVLC